MELEAFMLLKKFRYFLLVGLYSLLVVFVLVSALIDTPQIIYD
jgi:hypothetical protein